MDDMTTDKQEATKAFMDQAEAAAREGEARGRAAWRKLSHRQKAKLAAFAREARMGDWAGAAREGRLATDPRHSVRWLIEIESTDSRSPQRIGNLLRVLLRPHHLRAGVLAAVAAPQAAGRARSARIDRGIDRSAKRGRTGG